MTPAELVPTVAVALVGIAGLVVIVGAGTPLAMALGMLALAGQATITSLIPRRPAPQPADAHRSGGRCARRRARSLGCAGPADTTARIPRYVAGAATVLTR